MAEEERCFVEVSCKKDRLVFDFGDFAIVILGSKSKLVVFSGNDHSRMFMKVQDFSGDSMEMNAEISWKSGKFP